MGAVFSVFLQSSVALFLLLASYGFYLYKSYQSRSKEAPKTLFTLDRARKTDDSHLKPKKVFFIHGWPDDRTLFEKQAKMLAETGKYDCYRLELPNMTQESFEKNGRNYWGWDLRTVGTSLALTITKELEFGERIILVAHDWGAVLATRITENAEDLVEAIMLCDIGDQPDLQTLEQKAGYILYQGLNVLSFLSPSLIGDFIFDQCTSKVVCYDRSHCSEKMSSFRNYLYFQLWLQIAISLKRTGKMPKLGKPLSDPEAFVNKSTKDCRIMFVFGEKKIGMFHTPKFVDTLKSNGQKVVGLKDIGHWLMYHPDFDTLLMDFMNEVEAHRPVLDKDTDYSKL